MIIAKKLSKSTLVLMSSESEKEGLSYLGAVMAKEEFEKSHPTEGEDAEIEHGIICLDCNKRHGYCVTFQIKKFFNHW